MRFSADTATWARALRQVAPIISPQNTLPALSGIAIDAARTGVVHLAATDLTSEITTSLPAHVADPGGLVLPAETLVALVGRIPAATVHCAATGDSPVASLSYGKSRTTLHGFVSTEMPRLLTPASPAPAPTWTLEAGVLATLARQTLFATSRDASRPILTGVQVTMGAGRMRVVGTDGTRLSHADAPVAALTDPPAPFVVARRAFLEAARLAGPDSAILTHLGDRLRLETLNGTVTTMILDGTYPDVQRALPDPADAAIAFSVPTDALRAAIERLSVVALRDRAPTLSLHYVDGHIEMEAANDVGQAFEVLDVERTGPGGDESMLLHFDPRLLLEGVRSLPADVIHICLLAPDRPVRLAAADPSPYFHVVLPLRPAG